MLAYYRRVGREVPEFLKEYELTKNLSKTDRGSGVLFQITCPNLPICKDPIDIIKLDDTLDIWVLNYDLNPTDIQRKNVIGEPIQLANKKYWITPKLRTFPDNVAVQQWLSSTPEQKDEDPLWQHCGTDLEQYYVSHSYGKGFRVTDEHQAAYQIATEIFGWLSGSSKFTADELISAMYVILKVNYKLTKYDIECSRLFSRTTATEFFRHATDYIKWEILSNAQVADELKKNSATNS